MPVELDNTDLDSSLVCVRQLCMFIVTIAEHKDLMKLLSCGFRTDKGKDILIQDMINLGELSDTGRDDGSCHPIAFNFMKVRLISGF